MEILERECDLANGAPVLGTEDFGTGSEVGLVL